MRRATVLLFLAACVCFLPAAAGQPAPGTTNEKWARRIVDDFLEAAFAGKYELAAGLLSPELSRALHLTDYYPGEPRLRDSFASETKGGSYDKGSILRTEGAPDGREYIYKVEVRGERLDEKKFTADMTLRVAREAGGRWSIRFIRVKDRE